jgi:hypothetical protein
MCRTAAALEPGLVCRKVVAGMETMHKMESVATKKEGIFVMPLERITIHSTFVVYVEDPEDTLGTTMIINKQDEAGSYCICWA